MSIGKSTLLSAFLKTTGIGYDILTFTGTVLLQVFSNKELLNIAFTYLNNYENGSCTCKKTNEVYISVGQSGNAGFTLNVVEFAQKYE